MLFVRNGISMLCQKLAENPEDAIEPETPVEAMTNLNVPSRR
jgi:hypothetical protein